jgi:predicted nucleotidyltransferase
MRLSSDTIEIIKSLTLEIFGADAKVILFGSRIENDKKGGDMDLLLIPSEQVNSEDLFSMKIKLLTRLKIKLGDQKIDLLLKQTFNQDQEIIKEAETKGILLW